MFASSNSKSVFYNAPTNRNQFSTKSNTFSTEAMLINKYINTPCFLTINKLYQKVKLITYIKKIYSLKGQ